MTTELLKDRISVLCFPAGLFSWTTIKGMSDEEKRRYAEENDGWTTVFDSLDEFQVAVNGDEVDASQSFIFFVPNKFEKPTQQQVNSLMDKIKVDYHKGDACMADLLASMPAEGMTLEQAFELYMQMMKWAEGNRFFIRRQDEEPKEL